MRHFVSSIALCLSALGLASPVAAQIPDNVAQLEVRPGWRESSGTHMAALHITLAKGWKTYWRSPGDGGIPPRLMLEPTSNLGSVRIAWPVPEVFRQNGLQSIGYTDGVTLPLAISTIEGSRDVRVVGRIEIGVCEDICIPMQFHVDAVLPATGGARDKLIVEAMENRPMSANRGGVTQAACRVEPIADGLRVTAQIEMPALSGSEAAVLELPGQEVWISEAETARNGGVLEAAAEMVPPDGKPFALDRSSVRITVIGGGRAVDIRGC